MKICCHSSVKYFIGIFISFLKNPLVMINKKSHFGTFGLTITPIILNQMPFWCNSKKPPY
jgi:hypothetical protein